MIKVTAPGRAGIIGNPTDGYGGTMIACATKNYATCTLSDCDDLILENDFGETKLKWESDFAHNDDLFDITRAVLRYLKLYDLKARIKTQTNIPLQAGLAGSTAILSTVLQAIYKYTKTDINPYRLAETNRIIELNYLKVHCGYQDAYMTTFGGLNYMDFRGKDLYKTLNDEVYATVENISKYTDELPFVIAHTGIPHHSGQFHKPLRDRWIEGDKKVINAYRDIRAIAREGKREIISGRWDNLAVLMNENHKIQDSLTNSGDVNNYMIKTALKNGALAAKLAGAGGGGTIIALTYEPDRVKKALKLAGAESFVDLDPNAECKIYTDKEINIVNG